MSNARVTTCDGRPAFCWTKRASFSEKALTMRTCSSSKLRSLVSRQQMRGGKPLIGDVHGAAARPLSIAGKAASTHQPFHFLAAFRFGAFVAVAAPLVRLLGAVAVGSSASCALERRRISCHARGLRLSKLARIAATSTPLTSCHGEA